MPIRIELSARRLQTTVEVTNRADEATTIQAHIVAWNAAGVEELLSDNDEILLNPPIFSLAPGRQQFVRLGVRRPKPTDVEITYRLILEEVPPPPKPGFNGVNTVLKISIPIFIKPAVSAPKLVWGLERISPEEVRLWVENKGNAHVQVKQLAVTIAGRQEPDFTKDTAAYVLRNGRKEWVIRDKNVSAADHLSVEARTDSGDIHETLAPDKP